MIAFIYILAKTANNQESKNVNKYPKKVN